MSRLVLRVDLESCVFDSFSLCFDNGKEEGGFTFWSHNPCTVSQL